MAKKTVNAIKGKQGFQPTGRKDAPTNGMSATITQPFQSDGRTPPDYNSLHRKIPTLPTHKQLPLEQVSFDSVATEFSATNVQAETKQLTRQSTRVGLKYAGGETYTLHTRTANINWEGNDYILEENIEYCSNGTIRTSVRTIDPDTETLDSLDGHPSTTTYRTEKNGDTSIISQSWAASGYGTHRINGPAYISDTGTQTYYYQGTEIKDTPTAQIATTSTDRKELRQLQNHSEEGIRAMADFRQLTI